MPGDENWNIGAQLQTNPRKIIDIQPAAPEAVQHQQRGGGVGTATSQAAPERDALADADVDTVPDAGCSLQGAGGTDTQVRVRLDPGRRPRAVVVEAPHGPHLMNFELKFIA
jgi:hypothetical protein